jgi:hypothetical protein
LSDVNVLDAMTVIAKQLPEEGITFREFVTRAANMCGDSDETIEETIRLGELDGIMPDDIVKMGSAGTKLQ